MLRLQAFPRDLRGSIGESFPPTALIHTLVSSLSEGGEKTDCGKGVALLEPEPALPTSVFIHVTGKAPQFSSAWRFILLQ